MEDDYEQFEKDCDYIEEYPNPIKIVILGDSNVGKTSILQSLQEQQFNTFHEPTVGVDLIPLEKVSRNIRYKFNIWDTAGQEKFNSMVNSYCKGCDAILYVFAFNNLKSFKELKDRWVKQTEQYWLKDTVCMILGNKSDLVCQIDQEEIINFYEYMNSIYVETSAISGKGIKEAFDILLNMILAKKENPNKLDPSITLRQFGFDTSLTSKYTESSLHYTIQSKQYNSIYSQNMSINQHSISKSNQGSVGRKDRKKITECKSQPNSLDRSQRVKYNQQKGKGKGESNSLNVKLLENNNNNGKSQNKKKNNAKSQNNDQNIDTDDIESQTSSDTNYTLKQNKEDKKQKKCCC